MKNYHASINIRAPRETIWAILTDAAGFPTWDPGVERVEGRIAPGEQVTVVTRASPNRAFPARVTEFTPNERMTWTGGMPLGLFKGVRSFALTPRNDGSVDFTLQEVYSGPLLPLIGRSIPDLTQAFRDTVNGLKAAAENAAATNR